MSGRLSPWGRAARQRCSHQLLNGLRSGPAHGGGRIKGLTSPPPLARQLTPVQQRTAGPCAGSHPVARWRREAQAPVGHRFRRSLQPHGPRLGCHAPATLRAATSRCPSNPWPKWQDGRCSAPWKCCWGRPAVRRQPGATLASATRRQPQESKRGEHAPGRAGAGSPVGIAARFRCGRAAGAGLRPKRAGRSPEERRRPEAPPWRPDHGAAAAGVFAV